MANKHIDIAIVDCGIGNLRSVYQALHYVAPNLTISVTCAVEDIMCARRVVFPGQGAMLDCMKALDVRNLRSVLLHALTNKPFLGICIGMQILFDYSEESEGTVGLSTFSGHVKRFNAPSHEFKIPHIGWNNVAQKQHALWNDITDDSRFYYVHSYYVVPQDKTLITAETVYATPFTAAIARNSVFAVQFHPEKSASAGLQLLRNFVHWNP